MNIHEYQAKQIFREFGVAVPNGVPAFSVDEAVAGAKEKLEGPVYVVKAQIHAGGRGKAGGVKLAKSLDEVQTYANEILGKVLVTKQTGPAGKKVNRLLIEEGCKFKKELYLSFTVDRVSSRVVMIGSEEGGMEIEEVAAKTPEKIFKEYIDPLLGLTSYQATRMAFKMNFTPASVRSAAALMQNLYNLFIAKDCSLAEINPLVITEDDKVMALDAKLNFDDSALFRHPEIQALRDETEEDHKEREAAELGLNYVNLGGDVACMVNGAGLAMATVDIIKYYGGEPANFLDIGGQSSPEDNAKITNPHFKKVYRLYDKETGKAIADELCLYDETIDTTKEHTIFDPNATWKQKTLTNFTARELQVPIFKNGECVYESPSIEEIKAYCQKEVETLWDEVKRFENPHRYYVDLSQKLWDIKKELCVKNAMKSK